ncbi:MAG: dephospho-CoA kinase [Acidobacteria bacterium]|nr:dephospho-CoA kinase [Acidobacteriota bacterium]MBI3655000.1 dephospho-CoA kinase [Acidobacteriota bacterium]
MMLVGLTGGVASGKSHVAKVFAELGAYLIDADRLAHSMILPGTEAYREILEHFGHDILDPSGLINRKRLGDIVFSDPPGLQKLNEIVHPRVFSEQNRLVAEFAQRSPNGIIIFDAALLVETGAYKRVDKNVVAYCDPAVQLSRFMTRDHLTAEEAMTRIRTQLPIAEKLRIADYRIDTSGTFKETRAQIARIFQDLQRMVRLDMK